MSQAVLDELLQPDMHVPFFPDVSHVAVWAKRFFVLGEVFLLRMAKRPWGEMEAHVKEEPEAPHVEPPEVASGHDARDGDGGWEADDSWQEAAEKWEQWDADEDGEDAPAFGVEDCTWQKDEHPSSWADGSGWQKPSFKRGWNGDRGHRWQPSHASSSGSSSSGRYVRGGWLDANNTFWPILGMLL